ncbi:MAG TPA: helix-turn-helix domain-containing protein [Solirubrobacteraceae bacterium]|nr:helix-turn-helix domain-containing protein [Solirubrobacteraceae bacterium]
MTITLTDRQIAQVVRDATAGPGLAGVLSGVDDIEAVRGAISQMDDPRCSRATLRAVLVLAAFPADGGQMDLREVAAKLGCSPSTAHRYVCSWMAVGLLEQDPHSRRYRRAQVKQPRGGKEG